MDLKAKKHAVSTYLQIKPLGSCLDEKYSTLAQNIFVPMGNYLTRAFFCVQVDIILNFFTGSELVDPVLRTTQTDYRLLVIW